MGLLNIFDKKPIHSTELTEAGVPISYIDLTPPQVKLYNHVEIFNEYKEYKKGKKSYEIQSFDLWLVETYPNMLYIKRD